MANSSSIIDAASNYNIPDVINKGLAYAILLAGLLSVVFIIVGGFSFILSGGNEEKIKQAVGTIRYAIIGLIITILSVVIVQAVGQFIGLNVVKYLDLGEIFRNVQSLGETFKDGSGGSGGTVSLD
jgi:membrane protease YdiL (CAAX protease family)